MTATCITRPESTPAGTVIAPYAVWPREPVAEPGVNVADCPRWASVTRDSRVVVTRRRESVRMPRTWDDGTTDASQGTLRPNGEPVGDRGRTPGQGAVLPHSARHCGPRRGDGN